MWIVIGTIAIVIATISAGVLLDRRFGILPRALPPAPKRALPAHTDGEATATATLVTFAELELLRVRPCPRCKVAMHADESDVIYEGRALTAVSFRCPSCAHHEALYVELL